MNSDLQNCIQNGVSRRSFLRTLGAAGAAAATLLALGQATVTAEYRISFLSPAIGDTLIARGEVLKPGRSIIHTKCDVAARAGDRETLVATALSSMVPFAMRSG